MDESSFRFQTNGPRGVQGLPADRIVVIRMKVKEVYTAGTATPPLRTGIYRCKTWNGQIESKKDYLVYSKSAAVVNDTIFATRPIGGTGMTQQTKIVDWIEISIGAPASHGRKWDVWTTIDDAGTTGWTRPRFTNAP